MNRLANRKHSLKQLPSYLPSLVPFPPPEKVKTSLRQLPENQADESFSWPSEIAVYRFFDAEGELLYVGLTNSPRRRFREHSETKPWWHEVDRIEFYWCATRAAAEDEEAAAIWQEQPRYNVRSPITDRWHPKRGVRACEMLDVYSSMERLVNAMAEEFGT